MLAMWNREEYFNPHSREGSDNSLFRYYIGIWSISIHTPAKGVTFPLPTKATSSEDFNPHSREGSDTMKILLDKIMLKDFNPHSREGSDRIATRSPHNNLISIHTPAKGVTWNTSAIDFTLVHFNPHSREGSDRLTKIQRIPHRISIHTPAKGVTQETKVGC